MEDLKELIQQSKEIKKRRKQSYSLGYGIPRHSFNNIVYKLIEHGQYGDLFTLLKSLKSNEEN